MALEAKRTASGRLIPPCVVDPLKSVMEVEIMTVGAKTDREQQLSEWIDGSLDSYRGAERRRKPRIIAPFSATVRGVDANGKAFQILTDLHNLSAAGVYFPMEEQVSEGSRLFIVTRLSTSSDEEKPAARVAIRVIVLRVEAKPDGIVAVAAKILQNRFLWQRD